MTAIIDAPASVVDVAREHAGKHVDREVGGILLGTLDGDSAVVEVALPALKAVGHRAQVTFTHDVWEEVLTTVDRDHPDLRIVGWYHSHPGFGIFLSEYDKFIQSSFFSDPKMLALVVDPHSGEHGWFGWVDAEIELLHKEEGEPAAHAPAGSAGVSTATARRPRRAARVLAVAAFTTAGFVAGYSSGMFGSEPEQLVPAPSVTEQQWAAAQDEIAALNGVIAQQEQDEAPLSESTSAEPAATPRPAVPTHVTYRVRRGDNLWVLAESFYGDGARYRRLLRANPGLTADVIDPGQRLRVPIPTEEQGRDD
jgi:proteasome lid subunit RPN8/RPN11/LysM repeat protein